MARTKSGRFTKRRKSTKRNGLTRRQRAARKGARTRARKRLARAAASRRGRRRRGASSRRGSRRASVRSYPKRRRARRPARRSRRKPGGHFRTYRSLSRRYGPRRAGRIWRNRRKYVRANPLTGWLPSMSSVKDIVSTGAVAYVGFVGVNAGLYGLDKIGLANLKAKIGSPIAVAAINAVARILLTGIVAKVGSKVGLNGRSLALGGAFNVVFHAAQDVVASNPSMIPDAAKPMLLGYDGYGDWVNLGMNDWAGRMNGIGLLPEPAEVGTTLA